ncbi:hypothetical protein CSAG_00613 [Citrobacter portucalensis]|nr:hypothetical protein CSAG_00613 [Citrobacter portucalensis]
MGEPVRIIREGIVLMSSKLIGVVIVAVLLAGCSKARNPQCQDLADKYDGALIGGALSGGGYAASYKADLAEAQLNQCEMMFDSMKQQQQYQQQLQETAQEARREQLQAQAQAQQQEQKRKMLETLNSPEVQKKLRNDSLKDLVSCARSEGGERLSPDVAVLVSGACKSEIDRRVSTGKVSRATVDKLLNKQEQQITQSPKGSSTSNSKLTYASLQGLVDCEHSVVSPQSSELLKDGASSSYQCELEIDRRVDSGVISRAEVNKVGEASDGR